MSRKKGEQSSELWPINLTLPPGGRERIRREAARENLTPSRWLAKLALEHAPLPNAAARRTASK